MRDVLDRQVAVGDYHFRIELQRKDRLANKILYRAGSHIGEPAAEDDDLFLQECFVQLPVIDELVDIDSSKCILLGRTGSGKTAILKHIESTHQNTIRIEPKNVAFDYISNSSILPFLSQMGCDLVLLFQYMWKHILCSNAIQCYFDGRNSFQAAIDNVLDRKNPARLYFDKYRDGFWIEQDEILKEMTESFESKVGSDLRAVLGSDYAKLQAGTLSEQAISETVKKEIVARARKAVSEIQIRELHRAIEALNEIMENKQKRYFIIIDDLDIDWAQEQFKYQLINALIESIRNFRKIRNVKVITALRSDVYARATRERKSDGFQPEKMEGGLLQIKWYQRNLRELIDKRIEYLFKHQYTKSGVKFSDVFPFEVRKTETFKFLSERTQMRPRDLIAYFNIILDEMVGSTDITPRVILGAEPTYSRKRFDALCREWASIHPHLDVYLETLRGRTGKIEFSSFAQRDNIVNLCLRISEVCGEAEFCDEVCSRCRAYEAKEDDNHLMQVAQALVAVLYKVGAIELKLNRGEAFLASYRDEPIVSMSEIGGNSAFRAAPMLWRFLGVTPNIG